ncbi:MAG: aminoglycoside phosphotransferase family protein [Clostridia bacterium]|nr:aminoglycoside phosphotransferase family protein [Clostridia bacterium]
MSMTAELQTIIPHFDFSGELALCEPIMTGHLNRTYRLGFVLPDGTRRDYVLQRINTFAFKKPEEVMQNVQLVTEHLCQAYRKQGRDPANRVLRLVPVKGGGVLYQDDNGSWRAYDFITGARTIDRVDSPAQFQEIGRAFGAFQNMLSDFPIERLYDTIPNFHHTVRRMEAFERSVVADVRGRAASVQPEIAAVRARRNGMGRIVEMIDAGTLPLRVTHNDTKINNVMLDERTGEALCVIDLDTVMAGSALYDFGDAIRYGASTAAEDERDLSRVRLDIGLFSAYAEGFISETARSLTLPELENLPLGALVMTFENGMRFLTDYLDGDVYFHIEGADDNLARARCQLKLLSDMEAHSDEMYAITKALIGKYR